MVGIGAAVRRVNLGFFIRPAQEVGGPEPRVEPVLGYLVRRPEGILLFDTGLGAADEGTEAHYRPHRRDLNEALAAAGVTPAEISHVVNCHLHFDHCGGNRLLPGRAGFCSPTTPPFGNLPTADTHLIPPRLATTLPLRRRARSAPVSRLEPTEMPRLPGINDSGSSRSKAVRFRGLTGA